MPESRSARIIHFPVPSPDVGRPPRRGPGRLAEALAALDGALAEQRDAVARFLESQR